MLMAAALTGFAGFGSEPWTLVQPDAIAPAAVMMITADYSFFMG
jgi:hypothetical protein